MKTIFSVSYGQYKNITVHEFEDDDEVGADSVGTRILSIDDGNDYHKHIHPSELEGLKLAIKAMESAQPTTGE